MKVTDKHYQVIKTAFQGYTKKEVELHHYHIVREGKAKNLLMRLRWDIFTASGLTRLACDDLYSYCDDSHIDTALRKALKEVHGIA